MSTQHESPYRDPELVAAVSARAAADTAYHEAGHAVAAVARGGTLQRIDLGYVDWSSDDTSGDRPAGTLHASHQQNAPFITFAGPWAQATWAVEVDPEKDFDEALVSVWDDNFDGDEAKYSYIVTQLAEVSTVVGLPLHGTRPWELQWGDELEELWPAVSEVARLLLDGQTVTHTQVRAAIDRLGEHYYE